MPSTEKHKVGWTRPPIVLGRECEGKQREREEQGEGRERTARETDKSSDIVGAAESLVSRRRTTFW